MKIFTSFLFLFLWVTVSYATGPLELNRLKSLFEKFDVNGSILIYDQKNNQYMGYNPARWNESFLPASTFKIPHTLIALETDVISPDSIIKWNGERQRLPVWEKDMTIAEAFRVSAVPFYRELARRIGIDRMQKYLRLFNYGEMDVHADTIDNFWLEGKSNITSYQQVYFLQKLYHLQLPVSEYAMLLTREIMVHTQTDNYRLSGKTGWETYKEKEVTWFVGYLETVDNVYFFATNLEPTSTTPIEDLGKTRIALTLDVFTELDIVQ